MYNQDANACVLENKGLIEAVIKKRYKFLARTHVLNNMRQAGMIALWKANEKYDPSKNISFKAYAMLRIVGHIKDEFRSLDSVSRQMRRDITSGRLEKSVITRDTLPTANPDEDSHRIDGIWDEHVGPFDSDGMIALDETLEHLIRGLPHRYYHMARMYFYTGFTLLEVANAFKVTEGRVSQIMRGKIIPHMRERGISTSSPLSDYIDSLLRTSKD